MSLLRSMSYAYGFKLNLAQSYKKVLTLFCILQFLFNYFFHLAQISKIVHQKKSKKK